VSALGCLTVFPDTIDWLAVHQQKAPVLKALGAIVDDRKKRVRKEAVDCRTRWFLFKAP
jgi:DNA repair/transcription protein MET18/MMS19